MSYMTDEMKSEGFILELWRLKIWNLCYLKNDCLLNFAGDYLLQHMWLCEIIFCIYEYTDVT